MTLEDLYRLLRAGHVQAQGVVDTLEQPLLVLDQTLCVVSVNPAFLSAFRVTREDTLGQPLSRLGNGQWDSPALIHLLQEVIPKAAAVLDYEVSHDFPEIGRRTMLVTARRLSHPDNNSLFMVVVFEDVTDRRREEVGRDLLTREIEHRLKNFLALVTALARQTPAEGAGAEAYRDQLLGRLEVLTAAETGLFAPYGDDLAALVTAVLAPYGERIRLARAARVPMSHAQLRSLSMILHELATNALKYGGLSVPQGLVRIGWSVAGEQGRDLVFDWREEGGPPRSESHGPGFGTRLITSLVRIDLGGEISMEFESGGLHARITMPLGVKSAPS